MTIPAVYLSQQRLSREYHDQLETETASSWDSTRPGINVIFLNHLNELCVKEILFVRRGNIEPAHFKEIDERSNRRKPSQIGCILILEDLILSYHSY